MKPTMPVSRSWFSAAFAVVRAMALAAVVSGLAACETIGSAAGGGGSSGGAGAAGGLSTIFRY